jgi:hypothetical protein
LSFLTVVLLSLAAVAIVFRVMSSRLAPSPLRGLLRLLFTAGLGIVITMYGGVTAWKIAHAARISVGGTIHNVAPSGGKGAHTSFDLDGPSGTVALRLPFADYKLREDDEVLARYVDGFGTVTHLEVRRGWSPGLVEDSGDGTSGAEIDCGVGVLVVLAGLYNFSRDPNGTSRR